MDKKQALADYLQEDVNNIIENNGLYKTNNVGSRTYRVLTETEANVLAVEMVKAYTGETTIDRIAWRIDVDGRENYTSIDRKERKQNGFIICLEDL